MNRLSTLSTLAAIALSATLVSTAALASSDEAELSAPLTVASTAASASGPATGLTRAEVIAEMNAARARGELQAGHEWGVDIPPVQTAAQKVRMAAAAAAPTAR